VRAGREHPHASVLAGRIQLFQAVAGGNRSCEKYQSLYSFNQAKNVAHGFCVTANWMSPRKTLLDLGGFDVELKSGGDVDLSRRIRAVGQVIVYVPDMVIKHPMRGSLFSLMAKRRRTVGGLWQSQVPPRRFHTFCVAMIKQGVWTVRKTLLDRQLSLIDRIRVSVVVMALWGIGMIELIRLACGGESKRA
jgi:GT2 family glycosyltransferase